MSIESVMRGYLVPFLSVGDRIYPMGKRPQEAELPAVTYQLVGGPTSHYSHGGVSDYEVSYQFDCWAADADDAMDLDLELRDALDGFRGDWDGYTIGSVFLSSVVDDYEPRTGVYRRLRQVDVHYREPDGS
jgi:hypothetical protein